MKYRMKQSKSKKKEIYCEINLKKPKKDKMYFKMD